MLIDEIYALVLERCVQQTMCEGKADLTLSEIQKQIGILKLLDIYWIIIDNPAYKISVNYSDTLERARVYLRR